MTQNPVPPVNPETDRYFAALREGKLLIKSCRDCGQPHFYPRAGCPFCFSEATDWHECSGKGKIYSYSVLRAAPGPTVLAYVALDEGPTMMTAIVDSPVEAIAIGASVSLAIRPGADGTPAPMFTLT